MARTDQSDLRSPRSVPTERGGQWLREGWEFFKQAPGVWVGMFAVYILINVIAGVIPFVSIVLTITGPIFFAGFVAGAAAQARGETLKVTHLFTGFSVNPGRLAALGLAYLAAMLVIAVIGGIAIGTSGVEFANLASAPQVLLLALVIVAVLLAPVLMAYWFAPALILLGDLSLSDALRASFLGCWRNPKPFLVYGALSVVLLIVASIPLLLGMLILAPVLFASNYASYRDVFPA